MWVALQCLSISDLMRMMNIASKFTLQCLCRSEPSLMRMSRHVSRLWVAYQCLRRSEPWWEWLNIYLGCESLLRRSELLTRKTEYTSSKWVHSNACTGQNHWPEWLNIIHWQIVSLSLQCLSSRTTDKNKHTVCESLSAWSVWADQYHLQEWLDMHPACEFTF